jgi:radical SAM protein with 4Fe4S-binding SPASM domain
MAMEAERTKFAACRSRLAGAPLAEATVVNDWLRNAAYQDGAEVCLGYPAVFEIEPTALCAMRCVHCPRPTELRRRAEHISPETLARVASQMEPYAQNLYAASGNGMLAVNFMHYGEPALAPHYGLGIRLLKERGVRVVSSSTASEFSAEAAAAAVESGLDELWLIFDGMDNATFHRMRGPRADFARGLACLDRLCALKAEKEANAPDIVAMMVRHPLNRHQWAEFEAFFSQRHGIRHYLAHLSTFAGRQAGLLADLARLADDPTTRDEQERVAAINAHPCRYPWHSVSVLADGRVVPCCRDINGDMILGDLNRQSLSEIWNGPAIRSLRRALAAGDRGNPLCRACCEASLEIGIPNDFDRDPLRQWLDRFTAEDNPKGGFSPGQPGGVALCAGKDHI